MLDLNARVLIGAEHANSALGEEHDPGFCRARIKAPGHRFRERLTKGVLRCRPDRDRVAR